MSVFYSAAQKETFTIWLSVAKQVRHMRSLAQPNDTWDCASIKVATAAVRTALRNCRKLLDPKLVYVGSGRNTMIFHVRDVLFSMPTTITYCTSVEVTVHLPGVIHTTIIEGTFSLNDEAKP